MAERLYTNAEAIAAMCIIEEIVEPQLSDVPWQITRYHVGIRELRDMVLDILAGPCNAAFDRAYARWEADHTCWDTRRLDAEARGVLFEDDAPADPSAFDYEFVPFWLRNCVDWSGDQPRVRGSAQS